MQADDVTTITSILQGGGNAALVLAIYFIWKTGDKLTTSFSNLCERLARLEKALDKFMEQVAK